MKNNKGFSLVEMLVAVAIASTIGVAVMSFMTMGAKSFSISGRDVSVQHEAQLVFNQIQEMIVDANIGLAYKDDGDKRTLTMFNYDPGNLDKHVYEVVWDKNKAEIYYNEYLPKVVDEEAGGKSVTSGTEVCTNQLLGEHITVFTVDLSDMEKKRVVRMNLGFQKGSTDYKSSHNITLRNEIVEGSKIPSYVENPPSTIDPEKIEGVNNLFAEPGQVIELPHVGGYKVKAPGGNDYPDQDMRFFMSENAPYENDTTVSTAGLLTISKAQKNDFFVSVSTRTGKGTPLLIRINMIVVDSVEVKLVSRDDGKAAGEPLDQRVAFQLEAKVIGRNLDHAANPSAMVAINWALGNDAEKYVVMGAATPTATGSKCNFVMGTGYIINTEDGKDPFEINATAVRSLQIPYYSGVNQTPVIGTFGGEAYMEQGHFTIEPAGSIRRGDHTTFDKCFKLVRDISGSDSYLNKAYVTFVGVRVNKLVYHQEENSPSKTYEIIRNTDPAGTLFSPEGANYGIHPPDVGEGDPNVTLEYELTLYVFPRHDGDSTNEGVLRMFPLGATEADGYKMSEAKYRSNTISLSSERVLLYFNHIYYGTNEYGYVDSTKWTGDMTAFITPRATGGDKDYVNEWTQIINTYESDSVMGNQLKNNVFVDSRKGFKIYYQKDGSWVEFNDDRCIPNDRNEYNGLTNYLEVGRDGQNLRLKGYEDRWVDDVPDRVRVVPNVEYVENGQTKYGVLFDNYVDVYLWNIEVPRVKDYQKGIKHSATGSEYIRLYLPCPSDPSFEGMANWSGAQERYIEWRHPYPANVADHREDIKNLTIYYKMARQGEADGRSTWYLHLKYFNEKNQWENLGTYMCKSGERHWQLIAKGNKDGLGFEY